MQKGEALPDGRMITKELFLSFLACHTLGHLMLTGEISARKPNAAEQFWIEEGLDIHKRARALFPDGIFVESDNISTAAQNTGKLIDDPQTTVIFEGVFIAGRYVVRPDILIRQDNGWRLVEVKSGTRSKQEHIDDMAYTAMVLKQQGMEIPEIALLHISKDFRLGMPDRELFVEENKTKEVSERMKLFIAQSGMIEKLASVPTMPKAFLKPVCRGCPVFKECMGKGIENHIFELYRLGKKKFIELNTKDIHRIEDIPENFGLTKKQKIMRECVIQGKAYSDSDIARQLARVKWPAYYLDFETISTAIPLYPDVAPYEQIPTQFSVHVCNAPGKVASHHAYLAHVQTDQRRQLAENLLEHLGEEGSIIVYSSAEKTIINSLAGLFPDLESKLTYLKKRLVDLEKIIRNNFYHPCFHGRTSIKVVLPVLVADMSYDDLEIGDGGAAMAVVARMAAGKHNDEEVKTIRKNLLEYCRQDTLAMVRVHERLLQYAA